MTRGRAQAPSLLAQRLTALVRVAEVCRSAVSLDELSLLLPAGWEMDAPALRREILTNPPLAEKLSVVNGYVGLRGDEVRISTIASRAADYARTVKKAVEAAQRVSRRVGGTCFVGVTGSVAFGTPESSDDIDLFLVAPKGRLWIELFKIFLTVKALNAQSKIRGEPVRLCLSFALDDEFCREEFSSNRTAMFAREALNVIPVTNVAFYFHLLRENAWMGQTFPKLYRYRARTLPTTDTSVTLRPGGSPLARVADASLYMFFGLYVRIRSEMKRLRLRKDRRYTESFDIAVSRCQWTFPHARYSRLAKVYDGE